MLRLYAHRGAAAERPENTLPGFELALELGANALEMDVHRTRDGHVVVSHDGDGKRMTGVDRAIADSTWADVQRWDAGYGFIDVDGSRPFAGRGFRIPQLDDVLESFPDTVINIDLKARDERLVDDVLGAIERHGAWERVQLASFDWRTLLAVRRRGYRGITSMAPVEVALALSIPAVLFRHLPYMGRAAQLPTRAEFARQDPGDVALVLGAGKLPIDELPGYRQLSELPKTLFPSNAWLLRRVHRLGVRVDFWTVNDVDEAIDLAALGADGIMTDDPRTIAAALGLG